MLRRIKCTVEYDGAPFCGWQRQSNLLSVQEALENAFFVALNGFRPKVTAAGRTDAGVHAEGQVFHADVPPRYSSFRLRGAINALILPHPIVITHIEPVIATFHARFSAIRRFYRYDILNRRARSPLLERHMWHIAPPLDIVDMRAAAARLIGRHDFTSFRDTACQSHSPIKTLETLEVASRPAPGGDGHIISLHVSAPSFLHHQVRIIAGTLADIGRGKYHYTDIDTILAAKTRKAAGITARPYGLYFTHAEYPQCLTETESD